MHSRAKLQSSSTNYRSMAPDDSFFSFGNNVDCPSSVVLDTLTGMDQSSCEAECLIDGICAGYAFGSSTCVLYKDLNCNSSPQSNQARTLYVRMKKFTSKGNLNCGGTVVSQSIETLSNCQFECLIRSDCDGVKFYGPLDTDPTFNPNNVYSCQLMSQSCKGTGPFTSGRSYYFYEDTRSAVLQPIDENDSNLELYLTKVTDVGAPIISTVGHEGYLYVTTNIEGRIYKVNPEEKTREVWFDVKAALTNVGRTLNTQNFQHSGVRGIAFHPDFNENGFFYTTQMENRPANPENYAYISDPDQPINADSVLSEWFYDKFQGIIIEGSYREVLRIGMPVYDHPIKQFAFSNIDKYLYISHGDGSVQSATAGGGLRNDALGKILRINPLRTPSKNYTIPADNPFLDNPNFPDECWAVGFRNPHHIAFAENGDLIVADCGRDNIEEIDIVIGGESYGWPDREGTFVHKQSGGIVYGLDRMAEEADDYTYPVVQLSHYGPYARSFVGTAIAGGFPVENGSPLDGTYWYVNFPRDGVVYYSYLDEMRSQTTKGPKDQLTQATIRRASKIHYDGSVYENMGQIISNNRADIRFGKGSDGTLYITTKWRDASSNRDGVIFRVENSMSSFSFSPTQSPVTPRPTQSPVTAPPIVNLCASQNGINHCETSPDGSRIYAVSPNLMSWTDGTNFCRGIGGELVSLNDENERQFVESLAYERYEADAGSSALARIWTSLNDIQIEQEFVYADGSECTFGCPVFSNGQNLDPDNVWYSEEPNNLDPSGSDENCVEFYAYPLSWWASRVPKWNDAMCSSQLRVICEIPVTTTKYPSVSPTLSPSSTFPSISPSLSPTNAPSISPTTLTPTLSPTTSPSVSPTLSPSSASPTISPSHSPTNAPSSSPSTLTPSLSPTTSPSVSPTLSPSSASPTISPSLSPTDTPSSSPATATPTTGNPTTNAPNTHSPTPKPSLSPTHVPSNAPTKAPSISPTIKPSNSPSFGPTISPIENNSPTTTSPSTTSPSLSPTKSPATKDPTTSPTKVPSTSPSTESPVTTSPSTLSPSPKPSQNPSFSPSISPSFSPSTSPSTSPSISPSISPSLSPSLTPTLSPTSTSPTKSPSPIPSTSGNPTNLCQEEGFICTATFDGEGSWAFYDVPLTWNAGNDLCESNGKHLISIHSRQEYDSFISSANEQFLNESPMEINFGMVWTGLNDKEQESDFRYTDGTPWDFGRVIFEYNNGTFIPITDVDQVWKDGEPNNEDGAPDRNEDDPSEHCVQVFVTDNSGSWFDSYYQLMNDGVCDRVVGRVVCYEPLQQPVVPPPVCNDPSFKCTNAADGVSVWVTYLPDVQSWLAARDICESELVGGNLPSLIEQSQVDDLISVVEENAASKDFRYSNNQRWAVAWTGLNDIDSEGTYVWSDGNPSTELVQLGSPLWWPDEPNNQYYKENAAENCIAFYGVPTWWWANRPGYLNDVTCGDKPEFLEEYSVVCSVQGRI